MPKKFPETTRLLFEFIFLFCYHDSSEGEIALPKTKSRKPAAGFIFFILCVCLTRMAAMTENLNEFYQKLPDTIAGWKKAAPPILYTPENLFTYIDGGAELFLSYKFQKALSLKYKDRADNEIGVDIFDMGFSHDAFGVFAHSRETIDSRFGQGCEYAAGLLTFWKDRYYVSILAYPETAGKKEVVFRLGREIAGAIKSEGALPPIIALLPAENLIPETVRYFHHYIWLNSFCFVSNENILNIGNDTPAALGKYRQGGGTFFLLLVRYPDEARARTAFDQFRHKQLQDSPQGLRQAQDGRWTGCQSQGDLFSAVFNAPDAQTVRTTLAKVKK
jgi:hypothetical protein